MTGVDGGVAKSVVRCQRLPVSETAGHSAENLWARRRFVLQYDDESLDTRNCSFQGNSTGISADRDTNSRRLLS